MSKMTVNAMQILTNHTFSIEPNKHAVNLQRGLLLLSSPKNIILNWVCMKKPWRAKPRFTKEMIRLFPSLQSLGIPIQSEEFGILGKNKAGYFGTNVR